MKKKVLFVILEQYSDRGYPLLADALQLGIEGCQSDYEVKTTKAGYHCLLRTVQDV